MKNLFSCYDMFGLSPGASIEDIKKAYKDMLAVWDPSKYANDPRLLNKAHDMIKKYTDCYNDLMSIVESAESIRYISEEERSSAKIPPEEQINQKNNSGSDNKAKILYNDGCKEFDAGYYENAIEKFTKAIQGEPSYAKAYANRGFAYRKLKRHAEAMVDLKAAARLGSTAAKDDLLKRSRTNKIILGTVAVIAALMIISAWQDNNEKVKREEMQRQEMIAADQARIKAEQERSAFQEEYMREYQKKRIHDLVYGNSRGILNDSMSRRPLDDPMTRTEMANIARDEAKRAIRNDRLMPAP